MKKMSLRHTIFVKLVKYLKYSSYSLRWLYASSFVIIIILILTMSSVLPIDVIVQSKTNNSHLATNTVIILVICVAFIIISVLAHTFRLFYNKMLLQDIPRPYIPITEDDIGKSTSQAIELEMVNCQRIKRMAKPKGNIRHPGLYHQSEDDQNDDLPDNLIYENVIRVIGQELKYNGTLTISDDQVLRLDNHYSLSELLNIYRTDSVVNDFLLLYERLRFSGQPITCDDFKLFLEEWGYVKTKL